MQRGFSLVELSIVLVILGLLTGGILAGQSLIRASELRSLGTEYSRYTTAMNTFRDKYFAIPGDMSNATSFWGKDSAQCNAQPGTTSTPGTCNGNGNGLHDYGATANATAEMFRAWQQLALAGLIEGTYSGNAGSYVNPTDYGASDPDIGINSPASKIPNVGWSVTYVDATTGSYPAIMFRRNYRAWMNVGTDDNLGFTDNPFLTPAEAWNIDTKMDDGRPAQGKVQAWWTNCTTAANDTNFAADYNLTSAGKDCNLLINPY